MYKSTDRMAHDWVMENYPEASPEEVIRMFSAFTAGIRSVNRPLKTPYEIIIEVVCDYQKMPETRIFANTRKREIVFARQVIMYFGNKYKQGTLRELGDMFGKNHSTALHSIRTINNLIDTNPQIRHDIGKMDEIINKRLEPFMNYR
jgi:chromosomal replication initiation ATPase DnaA